MKLTLCTIYTVLSCVILSSCPNGNENPNALMPAEFVLSDFESGLGSGLGSEWEAWGDDSDNGGTTAVVSRVTVPWGTENEHCLELSYRLGITANNPYPACSAGLIFSNPPYYWRQDFSEYDGIEFTIASSLPDDKVNFGITFHTDDGNFDTQYEALLALNPTPARITLLFSELPPGSWFIANNSVPSSPTYDQCYSISINKKGSAGEEGSIYLNNVKLFSGSPANPLWGNPPGPTHSTLPATAPEEGLTTVDIAIDCLVPYQAEGSRLNGSVSGELYGTDTSDLYLSVNKASSLGIKILRCGPLGSYNWRNAKYVGLDNQVHDGLRVEDLVAYARSIGAEPLIEVNLKGWAPDETTGQAAACMDAADAADLVRRLNGELGLGVKYFFMDNEFDCWHQSCWQNWSSPCTADRYIELFTEAALAMKAAQKEISGDAQDIQIIGPEISSSFSDYKTNAEGETYGGLESFPPYFLSCCAALENDGGFNPLGYRLLDVFSFHLYPAFRTDFQDMYSFISLEQVLESTRLWWDGSYVNQYCYSQPIGKVLAMIPRFNKWIKDYYPGTRLGVTEFGIEADPNVPYPQIYRVLYMSKLFGIMAKHGLDFAVQHCLNDDQYLGLMDRAGIPRPQYFPLQLYAKHFKGLVLDAIVDSNASGESETVSAYACDDGKGYIVVMLVNEEETETVADIQLKGLTADAAAIKVILPRLSLSCVKLEKGGNIAGDLWSYGADQLP